MPRLRFGESVAKQIMAPALSGTKKRAEDSLPAPARAMMMEAMGRARQHVEDNFDYVGDAFAKEARDIHDGTSRRTAASMARRPPPR